MTTVAAVHTLINDHIKRGSAYTSDIPGYLRRGVRRLEENFSFTHMKKMRTFTLDHTATYPRFVSLPDRVKSLGYDGTSPVRLVKADGSFIDLAKAKSSDFSVISSLAPTHYWREGENRLVLNNTPQESYPASELRFVQYTDWPTVTTADNWWTNNAENLIAAEAVIQMHPLIRDRELFADMKILRDEALKTLLDADEEATQADLDEVMNYTINYDFLYGPTATG